MALPAAVPASKTAELVRRLWRAGAPAAGATMLTRSRSLEFSLEFSNVNVPPGERLRPPPVLGVPSAIGRFPRPHEPGDIVALLSRGAKAERQHGEEAPGRISARSKDSFLKRRHRRHRVGCPGAEETTSPREAKVP